VRSLEPFHKPGDKLGVLKAAQTGFIDWPASACSGVIGGPGIGTGLIGAGLGAIPVVGGFLKKAFGAFGAHHAAAVKNERATACEAVPAANTFLRQIDAALTSGEIDVATAAQALEQGYQEWLPSIQGIIQEHGNTCNAGCIYRKSFRAAIEMRKQNYALITAQNSAGAQGVAGGVVNAVKGAVSSFVSAVTGGRSSSPALAQAGLTPARQNTLALFVAVGIALVSVAVVSNFFGGSK